eukprot:2190360-Rhodomonas_salina.1
MMFPSQVDFVTNATIAAAWDVTELHKEKTDGTSGFRIYHSTSSCLNPVSTQLRLDSFPTILQGGCAVGAREA